MPRPMARSRCLDDDDDDAWGASGRDMDSEANSGATTGRTAAEPWIRDLGAETDSSRDRSLWTPCTTALAGADRTRVTRCIGVLGTRSGGLLSSRMLRGP